MKRLIPMILLTLVLSGCAAAPAPEDTDLPAETLPAMTPFVTPEPVLPIATQRPKPTEYPEGAVALEWLALYTWVDEYDPCFHLMFDVSGTMTETDNATGNVMKEHIEIEGEELSRVFVTGRRERIGRIYMKDGILYIEREDEIGQVSYVIE